MYRRVLDQLRFTALPLLGVALVSVAVVAVTLMTDGLVRGFVLAFLVLLNAGLVLAAGYYVHAVWAKRTAALARTTDRLVDGEWDSRVEHIEHPDEAMQAAKLLNRLAGRTKKKLDALVRQRGDLQALVDAMIDPILLVDSKERIILINEPAARLFRVARDDALHRQLVHVVNDSKVLTLFEMFTRRPSSDDEQPLVQREIKLKREGAKLSFHAVATRTEAGGVLVVLRDVTTLANTLQMKTDFVSNASHELRTPLSAIKVAFETLQEMLSEPDVPAEHTNRCVNIIGGHLQRLENMLRDLLDLSRVEGTDLKPDWDTVNADDCLDIVRHVMLPLAREKGVNIITQCSFNGEPVEDLNFRSDRRLLDLIIKNLVENALKFTPAEGTVTVSLEQRIGDVVQSASVGDPSTETTLRVIDTGCGIPQQHLGRIFERFYQVDNVRTGGGPRGTGLGLAIVKHAAHALGGTIHIRSKPGRGTDVSVRFVQSKLTEMLSESAIMPAFPPVPQAG
ncbi:MAG: sensor histidine kinase [Phycisphaerae bacterium]